MYPSCPLLLTFLRSLGLDADDFGRWVEQIVGHEIPLSKPLDYEKLLTRAFFLMLVMVLFRYVKHLKVLTSHYLPFALIAIVRDDVMN